MIGFSFVIPFHADRHKPAVTVLPDGELHAVVGEMDRTLGDPHGTAASNGQFVRIAGRWINNQW